MMKKNKTIVIPFLGAILPLIIIVLLSSSIILNRVVRTQIYSIKTELGRTVTSDIEKGFQTWVEDQILLSKTIATENAIINACDDPTNQELYNTAFDHLKIIKNANNYYENVFTIVFHNESIPLEITVEGEKKQVPDGSIFMSSAGNHVVGLAAARNYSTEIRNGKDYFISEAYPSLATGTPIFVITVPVYKEGRLVGAAGVAPKMTYFTDRFGTQEYFGESEYVFIMDEDGNMIAHRDSELVLSEKGSEVLEPFKEKVLNNEMIFELDYGGSTNLYIAKKMELFEGNRANDWYFFYKESLDDMFAEVTNINRFSLYFVIIALLTASLFVYLIIRKIIVTPLKRVEREMNEIAEGGGDLTNTLRITSQNEVGRIAGAFNSFTGTLREMINRIKGSVSANINLRDRLAASTEETSAAVNEILSNIKSIQSVIKNLVEQTGTAGDSTSEISRNIDALTNQAESQSSAVEQSTAAVEEMISSLKSMAGTTDRNKKISDKLLQGVENSTAILDETYNSIQRVTTNIDSIREMTDVIDNISNQTNLLAMNAAIEAAHAGESGKGFAVVADEIRKLAENSSASSNKIAAEVKTIVEQIQISSANSKNLQTSLGGMIEELRGLALAFTEINSSSLEMSAGSDQVLNAMSALSELSIQLASAADKMKTGTGVVSTNIGSVLQLTETTKNAVEEISVGSNEILSAMNEMQDDVTHLGENTDILSREVDSFKTE